MAQDPEILLFDLGGVLVDVAPAEDMLISLGLPVEASLMNRWAKMAFWEEFETGDLDVRTFCERFIQAFSLGLSPEQVEVEFEAWNRRLLPGAADMLATLRTTHRLAVLTNTNEVHWKRLSGDFAIPERVDHAFASHLIGMRKPHHGIYRHVTHELAVTADQIVFFDDNPENVDAARDFGMQAWQVQGIDALEQRLRERGYLP